MATVQKESDSAQDVANNNDDEQKQDEKEEKAENKNPNENVNENVNENENEEEREEDEEESQCENRTVCISNLSDSLKADDIKSLFQECGKIEICTIKFEFGKGRVCYIKFENTDAAEMAVLLNDQPLDGKLLQIEIVDDEILKNYKQPSNPPQTTNNVNGATNTNPINANNNNTNPNTNTNPNNPDSSITIDQQTALQTVQLMSAKKPVNVSSQFRINTPSPYSSYSCFIQSTLQQLSGNGVVDPTQQTSNNTTNPINNTLLTNIPTIGINATTPNSTTTTTEFNSVEDLERQEKLARTIYVGNLNPMIQSEHLHEFFGVCGNVNLVKIAGNSTNPQAARYGFVEFETLEAARAAYNLSGHFLLDRPIKIGPAKNAILNPHPSKANIVTNPVKINHAMAKVRLLQQRITSRYHDSDEENEKDDKSEKNKKDDDKRSDRRDSKERYRRKRKRSRSRSDSSSRSRSRYRRRRDREGEGKR